ncbi:fatty acid desaturase [Echinicola sediminis]
MALILAWFTSLWFLLSWELVSASPLILIAILVQTHLYTGLFITAHDAMHGNISKNNTINHAIGWLAAILFSFNFYDRLYPQHHQHHRFVATGKDPDYHRSDSFFPWYWSFISTYVSVKQLLLMGVAFWSLQLFFSIENLLLFWILPALLSTFQLFYFGTFLPHKGEHKNQHKSGTLSKNHFLAFLSCYFFGYHYEHHDSPGTPWWRLWRLK